MSKNTALEVSSFLTPFFFSPPAYVNQPNTLSANKIASLVRICVVHHILCESCTRTSHTSQLNFGISSELNFFYNFIVVCFYNLLAEIPGVARDSIRNEGIREINYDII
jgi:hypothetical protein